MATNRITIRVNSLSKIEQLLQESYEQACKSINEIQNEMNKISNSTSFNDETTMGEKAAYGRTMGDFMEEKRKFIALKVDIGKLLQEIIKHNGNAKDALNDTSLGKRTSLDLSELRKAAAESNLDMEEVKTYNLKEY